jgi:CheY-like chemotaxis protein
MTDPQPTPPLNFLAAGGEMDKAREFHPDIILLDLGLPGLSGFEIARQLRSSADLDHVTLIALTGYGQDEDRRQTRAHGFDHHIVKPVDLEALNALINK